MVGHAIPAKAGRLGLSLQFGHPRGVTYRHEDFGTSHVGVGAHSLHRFRIRSVEPDFVTLLQTTMAGQAKMIVAVCRMSSSGCHLAVRSKDGDFLDNIFFPSHKPAARTAPKPFTFERTLSRVAPLLADRLVTLNSRKDLAFSISSELETRVGFAENFLAS